jgi:UDP-N-acetyl-D-galactosamine dehydrogenase
MTTSFLPLNTFAAAVIGLSYVGLPLAVELVKHQACRRTSSAPWQRRVMGFCIDAQRLEELRQGIDRANAYSIHELQAVQFFQLTNNPAQLVQDYVFVVTAPTPIDNVKRPVFATVSWTGR